MFSYSFIYTQFFIFHSSAYFQRSFGLRNVTRIWGYVNVNKSCSTTNHQILSFHVFACCAWRPLHFCAFYSCLLLDFKFCSFLGSDILFFLLNTWRYHIRNEHIQWFIGRNRRHINRPFRWRQLEFEGIFSIALPHRSHGWPVEWRARPPVCEPHVRGHRQQVVSCE